MESLYLLIPLSVILVLVIGGVLVWAVMSGQFEDLEDEGQRVLDDDEARAAQRAGPGDHDRERSSQRERAGKRRAERP